MKINHIFSLCLAVTLFVTANAKAEIVTSYTDWDTYKQLAGQSEWALIGSADFDKEKAPYFNTFTLTNVLDLNYGDGSAPQTLEGTYTMNSWDGMGAGYSHTLHGTGIDTGMSFSHNSANQFGIQTPDGYINAFYLNVGTHANEASTQNSYNITFYGADGAAFQTINNIAFGFAGFVFDDGQYLNRFEITTNGNKNTGYTFDVVLGDGTAAVPEPGTMLLFGAGLVGLGFGYRRKFKKS